VLAFVGFSPFLLKLSDLLPRRKKTAPKDLNEILLGGLGNDVIA
jgi:hypothetical protein